MNKKFLLEKKNRLHGKDSSRKAQIDEPIVELIETINKSENYYTTSSCSGRIIIIGNENDGHKVEKKGCQWVYVSHSLASADDVLKALESIDRPTNATLKFEAFVMHVCCSDINAAKCMHAKAVECGFRNTGMSVSRSNRIILAIRSTHSLEVPIIHNNILLVSQEYIKLIISIANEKLTQNLKKINMFYLQIKQLLECDTNQQQ